MNTLTGMIGQVPAPAAYVILAAAVLAESVLLLGAFIPTLTILLASGALARAGDLNLALVIATAASAVVTGDALGHRTGHLLGSRLRTGRLGRHVPAAAWQRAQALMTRRGGQAVFLSRFVPVVRTLTPHLAGATRLPYRRIAPYSLLAAPLWAGAEAVAGYAATASFQHVMTFGGPALAAAAAVIAAVALARKKDRRPSRCQGRAGATDELSQSAASTQAARLASEEAIPASWTAWSMPGGTPEAVTVTSVPSPAAARCHVIVMVPAYDGSSASNTARCTTRSGGTRAANSTSTTSVASDVLPGLSAGSR